MHHAGPSAEDDRRAEGFTTRVTRTFSHMNFRGLAAFCMAIVKRVRPVQMTSCFAVETVLRG